MANAISHAITRAVQSPVKRGVRAHWSGSVAVVADKTAIYANNFNALASGATLVSQAGWEAYDASGVSVAAQRTSMAADGAGVMRLTASDFGQAPGAVMFGYDAGSTDHAIRVTLSKKPATNQRLYICVGSTSSRDCLMVEWIGGQDRVRLQRNAAGTLSTIYDAFQASVGYTITDTSVFEFQVLGTKLHLFIDGVRFTPAAGADIGAHVKGSRVGLGSYGNGTAASQSYITSVEVLPMLAQITAVSATMFTPTVGASEPVAVAGTYAGTIQQLQAKVFNADTSAVIADWADVPATIGGGSFTASITLPKNSTTGVRGYKVTIRAKNDTGAFMQTGRAVVGYAFFSYGQSNAEYRRNGAVAGVTPTPQGDAYTYQFINAGDYMTASPAQYAWYRRSDGGQYHAFEDLASALDTPVGVLLLGIGAQSADGLRPSSPSTVTDAYDGVVRNRWQITAAQIANAKAVGKIKAILYTQGEDEGSKIGATWRTTYKDYVQEIISYARALSQTSTVPAGIFVIGQYDNTLPTPANEPTNETDKQWWRENWTAVRQYHIQLASEITNAHVSGSYAGVAQVEPYHYETNTLAGYYEANRRSTLSWMKALGVGSYDGRGPLITGATRSGATITLAVNLNGAASISGTGLTNYEVSTDDFATVKTISSVDAVGGNVVITLAADPGAPVKVRSYWGYAWGAQSTRVHAMGVYADGTTIPVEPLYSPITST